MNKEVFSRTVLKFANLNRKERIVFPDVVGFSVGDVFRGILFIYAGWSGPSVHAWKALTFALNAISCEDFNIYVIDADELPMEFVDQQLKQIPHGNGETYWIRDGNIVCFTSKYGDAAAEEIRTFTKDAFGL